MTDFNRRNTEDIIWNVLTSFGYDEKGDFCDSTSYFILDKKEAALITGKTLKARADAVAACIETAFAAGVEEFNVRVIQKSVFELLILFGFENILIFDEAAKNDFELFSGDTVFADGTFEEAKTLARIDIDKLLSVCEKKNGEEAVSKSLVFAEKGAEGVAYEICYTLRINGCIVEMYCSEGDINTASEYAKKEGHSAIIRCFADGAVEINELAKNEVIQTTLADFLGYYEDDDCGCDHGDDCDCGHHHK